MSNKPFKEDNTSSFTAIAKVPDTSIPGVSAKGISEDVDFKSGKLGKGTKRLS